MDEPVPESRDLAALRETGRIVFIKAKGKGSRSRNRQRENPMKKIELAAKPVQARAIKIHYQR
ncbi:hypothetical protein ABZW32_31350 [Streptomyces sp. NPDC004667]|uniref:hypothetical protein n=1 Tax=Streptomyces sp. NPDC004667 TaxID=3154285 RepID=UPI0033ACBE50